MSARDKALASLKSKKAAAARGDKSPARTQDNSPTRTQDKSPTRTKDKSPTRTQDKSPTRPKERGDKDKVDDFIKCELCKQMLDNPRTLSCLHSFCRGCILTYITETSGQGGASKGQGHGQIVCPVCLQGTSGLKGDKTAWVDELPSNEFLRSYLEGVSLKDTRRKCDTCRRQHKSVAATQWCSTCHDALCDDCVGFHNALKTTKGHKLEYMSKIRTMPLESIISNPHCKKHQGETVTRFCETHGKVVCDKCVASEHKACKDVKTLKDAAASHRPEVSSTISTLSEEAKLARGIYDDRSKLDRSLDDTQAKLLQKIQLVRKKINDNLMKCETQIISELYEVHGKEKAIVQAEMKEAQRMKKASNKVHGLAESSTKYGTECHVLQNMPGTAKQADHYKEKLAALNAKIRNSSIDFVVDGKLEQLMTGINRLGDIRVTSSSAEQATSQLLRHQKQPDDSDPEDELDIRGSRRTLRFDTKSMKSTTSLKANASFKSIGKANLSAFLVESFNGRSDTDTECCWFTGIAYMPNGTMVLVDRNNSKLKLVDRANKLVYEQQLEHQPFGITRTVANEIAITLPRENKVDIYEVGSPFVLKRSFTIDDRGYGISYGGDRYVIMCACASPPSIKVCLEFYHLIKYMYTCP